MVVSSPVAFVFISFSGLANSKGNQLARSTTNYKKNELLFSRWKISKITTDT
jgi:hypothetical protein